MTNDILDESLCPSILFRLNGSAYCINSRYVSSIMKLPHHQPVPDAPSYITGIFPFRGGSVTMFDMRAALKQTSLKEEFQDFSAMLDARKLDHVNWVNALVDTIENDTPFTLATDCRQCKLGKWYDSFHSDSAELTTHLAKMVEPHKKLHETAKRVKLCKEGSDEKVCKETALHEAQGEYMPQILNILDEAKAIFQAREFNEMVLVLSGNTSLGIVVDEVLAVGAVIEEDQGTQHQILTHSPYINRIVRSDNCPGELILEISVPAILQTADADQLSKLAAN